MRPLQQSDTTEREIEKQADSPALIGPRRLPVPYLYFALLLTNALCLFLLINVLLGVGYYVRDYSPSSSKTPKPIKQSLNGFFNTDGSPVDNGKRNIFQLDWFDFAAYEGIAPEYASDVLDGFFAMGGLGLVYQPWVGFSEPVFSSKALNIETDSRGFAIRRTANPKATDAVPTIYIFTMGGSPTFGYNVSDEHTWPSMLSKILNNKAEADQLRVRVEVVNYGRGYYYPSQETALLIDLFKSGHRPSLVVFMDGTNQGPAEDAPMFTDELAVQMQNANSPRPMTENMDWLPIARLASAIRRRLFEVTPPAPPRPQSDENQRIAELINRFARNQEISTAVAKTYGAQVLFFAQPNALYNYPVELYRLKLSQSFMKQREETQRFYDRFLSQNQTGRIDLSGLFEEWGKSRKAIVDNVHYSPAFNEFLAQHVVKHIDLKSLATRKSMIDESAATGEPRNPSLLNARPQ